jgi:hypothetical protein
VSRRPLLAVALGLLALPACQQKMAEQPYYRPLYPTTFFPDGRASRPLEEGVIARGQFLEEYPLATGLTPEEWARQRKKAEEARANPNQAADMKEAGEERPFGSPFSDQRVAKNDKVFVEAFPFELTREDLERGKERYGIYCVMCHGPMGNGKGKIWERGYLKPTSFHTVKVEPKEPDESGEVPLGYSRGYFRWGVSIPLREVPVGYIFDVITKGYGGMPKYAAQISPADRWRITAYVRALQLSQFAEPGKLAGEWQSVKDAADKATQGAKK